MNGSEIVVFIVTVLEKMTQIINYIQYLIMLYYAVKVWLLFFRSKRVLFNCLLYLKVLYFVKKRE